MISVQSDDFDVAAEYAALRDSGAGTGAIAFGTGAAIALPPTTVATSVPASLL